MAHNALSSCWIFLLTVFHHFYSYGRRWTAGAHGGVSHHKERISSMRGKFFDEILGGVIVHRKLVLHIIRAWEDGKYLKEINVLNKRERAQAREQTQTCSSLTVNGVADDLVRVVFGRLPGEQGRCAGVRRSSQVARGAGETFPHDDRQLGGGACCPQSIVCYALVITGILRCQLVDEQNSGALALDPPEWLDGLAVLQPVQYWRRLTCAVAHEPGSVAPGQGRCLGGLYNHRWCCSRWDTKVSIWASTCCLFPQWQQPVLE